MHSANQDRPGAAVRRWLRRRPRRSAPLLTAVIPVYDVERYLPECLDSLREQPLYRAGLVDVVIVDDGSRDGSGDIADTFATQEPAGRVRVIHQLNAGLGAARNVGVRAAHTPYLTFVDSDDTLPPDAWERMVQVIETTGSDLVIGKLVRDKDGRITAGRWMRRNHQQERLRLRVTDAPELLADVFAVNKIYRRDFWVRHGLAFPEGTRYEDQPTLTRALLLAAGIDVLPDVVYHWRLRRDGTSITDGRATLEDVRDRIATKIDTLDVVRDHAAEVSCPHLVEVLLRKVLPIDMVGYFRATIGNDDAYWQSIREMCGIWDESPLHRADIPVQQRLMGWLVTQDRRRDLETFLSWLDSAGPGEWFKDDELLHPFRGEPGLPPEVTQVRLPA